MVIEAAAPGSSSCRYEKMFINEINAFEVPPVEDWVVPFRPPPVACSGFPRCTCTASLANVSSAEVLAGLRRPPPAASFAFCLHAAARVPSGLGWLIGCHLCLKRPLAVCARSFSLFLVVTESLNFLLHQNNETDALRLKRSKLLVG